MNDLSLEKLLKASANKKRIRLLSYLLKNGESEIGRIAYAVKLPYDTAFRNLSILRTAGFLVSRTSNVKVLFKINPLATPQVKAILSLVRGLSQ